MLAPIQRPWRKQLSSAGFSTTVDGERWDINSYFRRAICSTSRWELLFFCVNRDQSVSDKRAPGRRSYGGRGTVVLTCYHSTTTGNDLLSRPALSKGAFHRLEINNVPGDFATQILSAGISRGRLLPGSIPGLFSGGGHRFAPS